MTMTVAELVSILTALGIFVSTVLSALSAWKSNQAHLAVNSRMDEFKRLFEEKFIALGELKERNAQGRAAAEHPARAAGRAGDVVAPTGALVVTPAPMTASGVVPAAAAVALKSPKEKQP